MPRDEGGRSGRPLIVFVSVSRGIGGPARSLLTVLRHLSHDVEKVLFAPGGALAATARGEGVIDHHVVMPHRHRDRRLSRIDAALELRRYVAAHRHRVLALHANGQTELNLTAPATLWTGIPTVMWAHASRPNPTAGWLGWFWRRRGSRVRWLAVSKTAREVLAATLDIEEVRHRGRGEPG